MSMWDEAGWDLFLKDPLKKLLSWMLGMFTGKMKETGKEKEAQQKKMLLIRPILIPILSEKKYEPLVRALSRKRIGEFPQEDAELILFSLCEDARANVSGDDNGVLKTLEGIVDVCNKRLEAIKKARETADKLRGKQTQQKLLEKALEVALKEAEAMFESADAMGAMLDEKVRLREMTREEAAVRKTLNIFLAAAKKDIKDKKVGEKSEHLALWLDLAEKGNAFRDWLRKIQLADFGKLFDEYGVKLAGAMHTAGQALQRKREARETETSKDLREKLKKGFVAFFKTFKEVAW